eukprot:scaffold108341_cov51-Phaeocystis_antarctica.AAC.4
MRSEMRSRFPSAPLRRRLGQGCGRGCGQGGRAIGCGHGEEGEERAAAWAGVGVWVRGRARVGVRVI